jgi:hypothetical protein
MAHPRVFLSSTFYDLKQIRADLERFVREMGYDPVLNERGSIPYGSDEKIEEYCYKEIELCDILVSIIGGRFGSVSQHEPYSISQIEIKTALDLGKQVYVFIDRSVLSEYSTYLNNKNVEGIRYRFVDDVRVYKFIEEVEALQKNNPIAPFETSHDIVSYLREQWAGLFQRFLQEQARLREVRILEDIQTTARTLNQLVTFLTEERKNQDQAIHHILLANHPAFQQMRKVTGTPYRIFFTNREEMETWLRARTYTELPPAEWGDPTYSEWFRESKPNGTLLKIHIGIFDETDKLKVYTAQEWSEDWIQQSTLPTSYKVPEGEDLPF